MKQTGFQAARDEGASRGQLEKCRHTIRTLKACVRSLELEKSETEALVTGLRAQIVTLTEENIHLRGKASNFQDPRELSLGIEQTTELLGSMKAKSVLRLPQPAQLFDEIDALKNELARKKAEHHLSLQAPSAEKSTTPSELSHYQLRFKPRVASRGLLKKKKKGQFVPSYLRTRK